MPRKAEELGPLQVSRLKEPGLHFVGGVAGLALQVAPGGSRSWTYRVMMGGKRREMGLGGYPDVTLAGPRSSPPGLRQDPARHRPHRGGQGRKERIAGLSCKGRDFRGLCQAVHCRAREGVERPKATTSGPAPWSHMSTQSLANCSYAMWACPRCWLSSRMKSFGRRRRRRRAACVGASSASLIGSR